MRSLWIHLKSPLCACKEWAHSHLVAQFWGYSALHSFLRSTGLTGNLRSASPRAASMWCWAAWSGTQSTRFSWWQRISRASPSLASSPSEHPQSPLLSQVLPSAQPQHPHTSAPVHEGFHCDQKGSIHTLQAVRSDFNQLCPFEEGLSVLWYILQVAYLIPAPAQNPFRLGLDWCNPNCFRLKIRK